MEEIKDKKIEIGSKVLLTFEGIVDLQSVCDDDNSQFKWNILKPFTITEIKEYAMAPEYVLQQENANSEFSLFFKDFFTVV